MISTDEDALICDLAETYGIFDYRALPLSLVATLSVGLRENSRIKMKLSGNTVPTDILLLASAVDKLSFLCWSQTEDARSGMNRPKSIVEVLVGSKKEDAIETFSDGKEFEEARLKLLRQVKNNG